VRLPAPIKTRPAQSSPGSDGAEAQKVADGSGVDLLRKVSEQFGRELVHEIDAGGGERAKVVAELARVRQRHACRSGSERNCEWE
jgi:hypothetical protein